MHCVRLLGAALQESASGVLRRRRSPTPAVPCCNTPSPAGEVLFGTDSHTCNAGAFGQFATGVGNTDAGFILGTGKLLIKVGGGRREWVA